jgi:hypothetical protein
MKIDFWSSILTQNVLQKGLSTFKIRLFQKKFTTEVVSLIKYFITTLLQEMEGLQNERACNV